MTKAEELYHQIAAQIPNTTKGSMFGALCLKAPNNKAGVMFWKDLLVFKLTGEDAKDALSHDGVRVFAPMGDREMAGWYQVPYEYHHRWKEWAEKAMANAAAIEVKPKAPKPKKGK